MSWRDRIRRWLCRDREPIRRVTLDQLGGIHFTLADDSAPYVWGNAGPTGYTPPHNIQAAAEALRRRYPEAFRQAEREWFASEIRQRLYAAFSSDGDGTFTGGYHDPRPDYCWRCDALPAQPGPNNLGLCAKCYPELKG